MFDYLALLNAVLITDIIFIIFMNLGLIKSRYLKKWYDEFKLSAVIADVGIILIVLIITQKIYNNLFNEFSIIKFTVLALLIQIIHDVLFYFFFRAIPKGKNKMIDVFKDYANEVSYYAIIGDSLMIIMACFLVYYLNNYNSETNIIILIVFVYLLQYLLFINYQIT
jgi:hypothetical protein